MSEQITEAKKASAFEFLSELQKFINKRLPPADTILVELAELLKQAKKDDRLAHMRYREGAFLNHWITPLTSEFLVKSGLSTENARKALLSESHLRIKTLSSGTTARAVRHPFKKSLGVKPGELVAHWQGRKSGTPVIQSCPDIALRPPSPHKIVIEGKFYCNEKATVNGAASELVADIYQAFFYLGLPFIDGGNKRPDWDYSYSCLLAYDASPEGVLEKAWASFAQEVREACWGGGNVFVMVLKGVNQQS